MTGTHEEEREVVYPPWMLQDQYNIGLAEQINAKAAEVYAGAKAVFSPSQSLGEFNYKTGTEERTVEAFMVHAVDPIIMSEDGRVVVIKRKGDPDRDKYAFPGGLIDVDKTNPVAAYDIRKTAAKELNEETGVDISFENGEIIGNREIVRNPRDIRIVSPVPSHYNNVKDYGLQPNGLMLITTQAVLFYVENEDFDKIATHMKAKSDAREVAAMPINQLLNENLMGLDHGKLLKQAVDHVEETRGKGLKRVASTALPDHPVIASESSTHAAATTPVGNPTKSQRTI